jgi:multimeric flavodoxin WrbA
MSDAPLVLGIAGSPRRHGNSEQLLRIALKGAEAEGARTQVLLAAEAGLRPCQGCNACSLTGECVQRDAGPAFYAAIDEADAFIVSSPVFFATVPSVLKILYDRVQPYWARVHVLRQDPPVRRPGGLMLVRGGGDPYGFVAAEYTTKSIFAVLGIDLVDELKVAGVDSPGDLGTHHEAIKEAEQLGRAVAAEALRRQAG